MISLRVFLLPLLAAPLLAAEESRSAELFAAMIMTKQQQASSVPTASGVLLHTSETESWERLGPEIQMISSATADPSDPETIFFACGNGIARTQDGGDSWRLVTGWRESDALQIAIDPENGDNVYAATAWGVTVSRDGGDTWTYANEGLPEYFAKGVVIDERDPSRLLLATTTGLFESTDRAEQWQRVESFPEVAVLRLRRAEAKPDLWIAGTEGQGVWISRDDGRSWSAAAPSLSEANIYAVAIDPHDSSLLAAGGWDVGAWISRDGGRNWEIADGALPSENVTAMIFDRFEPGRLWVSTFEEGTYFTDDHGRSWEDAKLFGAYVFDLGYLPTGD